MSFKQLFKIKKRSWKSGLEYIHESFCFESIQCILHSTRMWASAAPAFSYVESPSPLKLLWLCRDEDGSILCSSTRSLSAAAAAAPWAKLQLAAAADKNWACSLSWKKGLSGIKDKTLSYNNLSLGAPSSSSHYLHSSQVQVHKTTFISKGKKPILGPSIFGVFNSILRNHCPNLPAFETLFRGLRNLKTNYIKFF